MSNLVKTLGWTAITLGALAGIARLTLVDVWKIPDDFGISIDPTLSQGDTVLMLTRGSPGFGDLVRCADPDGSGNFVIGRIAGVAGDSIEASGRDLRVVNKRYDGEMACPVDLETTVVHPTSGEKVTLVCDQVQMGGRTHYRGYSPKRDDPLKTTATVGAGMFFLISDDRSYHYDSRDYGTVPVASCKNRIFFRLWGKDGWPDDKRRLSYIR
jgi:signal peptidase I